MRVLIALLFFGAVMCLGSPAKAQLPCHTTTGAKDSTVTWCGTKVGTNKTVDRFLGVQYGQAGVWQRSSFVQYPAVPPSYIAHQFGPKCLQSFGGAIIGESAQTCLNLNIWAPENAENLPVMFFIHGGAFIFGSNQDSTPTGMKDTTVYDGTWLAENKNVVVVTTNYRLGALGFLPVTLDANNKATDFPSNFGLWDQQLAMQWTMNNIAKFGGNPQEITIFGESAGAMSVGIHLVNPGRSAAVSGVRAAIMESNPLGVVYPSDTATQADDFLKCLTDGSKKDCNGTGVGSILAGDQLDPVHITETQGKYLAKHELGDIKSLGVPGVLPFTPFIDNLPHLDAKDQIMPQQPTAMLHQKGAPLPLLYGYNRTEGVLFAELANKKIYGVDVLNVETYKILMKDVFGDGAWDQINADPTYADAYSEKAAVGFGFVAIPDDPHAHLLSGLSRALTDFGFVCANLAVSGSTPSAPVWTYRLDEPAATPLMDKTPLCDPGNKASNVCHISELSYVFNSLENAGFKGSLSNSPQQSTANLMSHSWGNFANGLNPTGNGITWTEWSGLPTGKQNVINSTGITAQDSSGTLASEGANCALWNQFLPTILY